MSLTLSQDAPADSLLEREPLALLLAMLLDQQVPMERAFAAPYELQQRLGHDLDVHELAQYDPEALAELFDRLVALPGYGTYKAQIFVALLGKQRNVRPNGWREVAGPFGEEGVYRSIADVTDVDSLAKVREYKQQVKAAARTKK